MNIENDLLNIKKFHDKNKEEDKDLENIEDTLHQKTNYILEHRDKITDLIKQSVISMMKLNDSVQDKLETKSYYDFYQVRKPNKTIDFTYSLDRYNGICKRGYCMKSSYRLDDNEFDEFLSNIDAVNKFIEITGQPELIDKFREIRKIKSVNYSINETQFDIDILLTEIEQKIFNQIKVKYNFYNKQLEADKKNDYDYDSYNNNEIYSIIKKHTLKAHKKYLLEKGNEKIEEVNVIYNECKNTVDYVKECLSKWILLGDI
jgi:hypothetical protein